MSLPNEETQGGDQRGGTRRWKGKGPRPARHIPWPELFKHHQSVLTGHLKMMDMVRKHCVEGSTNHSTAQACVDRTHEMLRMFKKATATFVPPSDSIDRVPLGASSASMYPGYSPADHIYGEAASEFGKQMAELKKQGSELPRKPSGIEYDVATDKRTAKLHTEELKKRKGQESGGKQSDNQDGVDDTELMEGVEETDPSHLFVIDSNPTPVSPFQVNLTTSLTKSKNKANDKAKRRTWNDGDLGQGASEATHKKKKVKISADSIESTEPVSDDFEREAEAKYNEKEERRKSKKEKKRKRDSEPSELVTDFSEVPTESPNVEKPQKKKSKKHKSHDDIAGEPIIPDEHQAEDGEKVKKRKKRSAEDTPEDTDSKKKRHRKKDKEAALERPDN